MWSARARRTPITLGRAVTERVGAHIRSCARRMLWGGKWRGAKQVVGRGAVKGGWAPLRGRSTEGIRLERVDVRRAGAGSRPASKYLVTQPGAPVLRVSAALTRWRLLRSATPVLVSGLGPRAGASASTVSTGGTLVAPVRAGRARAARPLTNEPALLAGGVAPCQHLEHLRCRRRWVRLGALGAWARWVSARAAAMAARLRRAVMRSPWLRYAVGLVAVGRG